MSLVLLPPSPVAFPDPNQALDEPDGLLAAGGALSLEWLLEAYRNGIFPWFDADDAYVLWWSPKRRAVIKPGAMRVSRSLRKRLRNGGFRIAMDTAFEDVMGFCGPQRPEGGGTWITPDMLKAYRELHHQGYAHSVEVFADEQLVGGLYGVALGRMFFGESMFSLVPDASKVAFYWLHTQLEAWEYELIDCQILNPHLQSLGVNLIDRVDFLERLRLNQAVATNPGRWTLEVK